MAAPSQSQFTLRSVNADEVAEWGALCGKAFAHRSGRCFSRCNLWRPRVTCCLSQAAHSAFLKTTWQTQHKILTISGSLSHLMAA